MFSFTRLRRRFTRSRLRHFLVIIGLVSLGFDFIIGTLQFLILTNLNTWSFTITINAATLQQLANSGITLTDIGAALAFVPLVYIYLTDKKTKKSINMRKATS